MWLYAPPSSVRAVVLVVHGLNLRPERMDPLCKILHTEDFDVLRVALKGHQGSLVEMQSVTLEEWTIELEHQARDAQIRARHLGVPFFFLGFSLGGLLGCLLKIRGIDFDRQILMAPGIAPRPLARAIRLLEAFGGEFLIPSFSPEGYGVHDATSLAAYRATLRAVEILAASEKSVLNLPTLLIIDPKDTLVNFRHLTEFIQNNKLIQWKTLKTSTLHSQIRGTYHHLIIDEASLGTEEWVRVASEIRSFLNASNPEPL
ncbi:alpha/beta fold hydrolase [Bdellovibrionota bacterium FG-2]